MRKIILTVCVAMLVIFTATCQAIDYREIPISQAFGKNGIAVGSWYDMNGNLILQIGSDYTINGKKIISAGYTGDTVAFYKFRLQDGDIEILNFGSEDPTHNMLVLNDQKVLRQTQTPQYFESIGGIYLGMTKDKVMDIYGEPLGVENQPLQKISMWIYNGFEIFFQYDVVSSITFYVSSDRRFDISGLSATSSKEDFERKYETTMTGRGSLNIGHGEVITVREGRATLQILTPGFVL